MTLIAISKCHIKDVYIWIYEYCQQWHRWQHYCVLVILLFGWFGHVSWVLCMLDGYICLGCSSCRFGAMLHFSDRSMIHLPYGMEVTIPLIQIQLQANEYMIVCLSDWWRLNPRRHQQLWIPPVTLSHWAFRFWQHPCSADISAKFIQVTSTLTSSLMNEKSLQIPAGLELQTWVLMKRAEVELSLWGLPLMSLMHFNPDENRD